MNSNTLKKLQYEDLKEMVKNRCVSNLGKNLIDKLMPSSNIKAVKNRLKETTEGRFLLENSSSIPLQGIVNIDTIILNLEKGTVLDTDNLTNVSSFLRGCRKIKDFMTNSVFYAPTLSSYSQSITELKDIEEEINNSIRNNIVDSNATKELKRIRRLIESTEIKIEDKLNAFIKNSNNKNYIQEFFISIRNGRFTIPIKSPYKNLISGSIIDTSTSGSTVFIEPDVISKYTSELLNLRIEEDAEVYQVLSFLTGLINDFLQEIKINAEVIGQYDMILAKSKYSREIEGISPNVNDYGYINIINGRHPLLSGDVVPLNFSIGKNYRTLTITGPNAGGKTVVLKAVGLLTLSVMSGFHIPVETGSDISLFENIFADIGDDQSIENALSTFSSHVKNIAEIIKNTNKSTLLLFDEIGSGTEPNEGACLAISVLEEVYHKGAITIATTHYGEIKNYSYNHPDFENAAMMFNNETLEPLYKLIIGKSGNSNALWISKKMGINDIIISRARDYIENKSYNYSKVDKYKIKVQKDDSDVVNIPNKPVYEIGDRVYLNEYSENGIVYKPIDEFNNIIVLFDDDFIEINVRQIKLITKAKDLYPKDYDLNSLFVSYEKRKLERDIERGSKKALKKLMKKTTDYNTK